MAEWLARQRGVSLEATEEQLLYLVRDLAGKSQSEKRMQGVNSLASLIEKGKYGEEEDDLKKPEITRAETLSDYSDSEGRPDLDTHLKAKRSKKVINFKKPRTGVSAEVYGKHNPKDHFKAKEIPKSHEVRLRINHRLVDNFMFSSLGDIEKGVVVNAMEEKVVPY